MLLFINRYYNCQYPPILFNQSNLDRPILDILPIEPLHHNLLGPPNDLLEALSERFPDEIHQFYQAHNLEMTGKLILSFSCLMILVTMVISCLIVD